MCIRDSRTIERIDFTDFSFDYSNKEVYIRAKVTSNWLDENKSIIDKNEQTVYDFLVSSNNDEWKICLLYTSKSGWSIVSAGYMGMKGAVSTAKGLTSMANGVKNGAIA